MGTVTHGSVQAIDAVSYTHLVSTVGAKEIAARPVSSTVEALQGVVPGMNIRCV